MRTLFLRGFDVTAGIVRFPLFVVNNFCQDSSCIYCVVETINRFPIVTEAASRFDDSAEIVRFPLFIVVNNFRQEIRRNLLRRRDNEQIPDRHGGSGQIWRHSNRGDNSRHYRDHQNHSRRVIGSGSSRSTRDSQHCRRGRCIQQRMRHTGIPEKQSVWVLQLRTVPDVPEVPQVVSLQNLCQQWWLWPLVRSSRREQVSASTPTCEYCNWHA